MKKWFCILWMILFLISCEKVLMKRPPANDAVTNFEEMWQRINERYSFFSYKNIDWDSVYNAYRPKVYNGMGQRELFDVMADMLFELRDGHVNLITPFNISRNWQWYLNYPENFDFSIVERNYLGDDHLITGPLRNTIIDSVGYIYYSSFASKISPGHIDFVVDRFKDMKGIIIDVRSNGGGSTENVDTLASRFADKRRRVYDVLVKAGPAHDDFSEPVPMYVEPQGIRQFTGKVAVLTNRSSYSATNLFIQAMSVFPHVTIIGDKSGGGGGFPAYSELPNGWVYRFSSSVTLTPGGFNIENGIPPDIYLALNPQDQINGIDSIIERALSEIK